LQVVIDMVELQQLVLSILQNGLQQTQAASAAVSPQRSSMLRK
jgi:hypothetical protein